MNHGVNYSGTAAGGDVPPEVEKDSYFKYKRLDDKCSIYGNSSTFVKKGVVTNYSGTAPCGEFPPEVDRSFYLKSKQLHDTNTIYGLLQTTLGPLQLMMSQRK